MVASLGHVIDELEHRVAPPERSVCRTNSRPCSSVVIAAARPQNPAVARAEQVEVATIVLHDTFRPHCGALGLLDIALAREVARLPFRRTVAVAARGGDGGRGGATGSAGATLLGWGTGSSPAARFCWQAAARTASAMNRERGTAALRSPRVIATHP